MRELINWMGMIFAFAAATLVLGWWGVPVVGALWGSIGKPPVIHRWRPAAAAAAIAWAGLLAAELVGALGVVVSQLGGALRLPALVAVVLTLVFPALLAGSAAELAFVVRTGIADYRRSAESEG